MERRALTTPADRPFDGGSYDFSGGACSRGSYRRSFSRAGRLLPQTRSHSW
jgi:hypothetical protein